MPIVAGPAQLTGSSEPICTHQIGSNEEKDVTVDLTTTADWIGGDTVAAQDVDWSISPNDGTVVIDTDTTDGDKITVWVRTPKGGRVYRLKAHYTTAMGRVCDAVVRIAGIPK